MKLGIEVVPYKVSLIANTECMLPCLFGLFWPSFGQMIRKERRKKNLSLLDLSASPQVKRDVVLTFGS